MKWSWRVGRITRFRRRTRYRARQNSIQGCQQECPVVEEEALKELATDGGGSLRVIRHGELVGMLRLRQRPGPRNALGSVKFAGTTRRSPGRSDCRWPRFAASRLRQNLPRPAIAHARPSHLRRDHAASGVA